MERNLEGVIVDFTEIIRINPNDAKTYHRRGNARRDQGDLEGAIADYKEGLRVNPNHTVMRCETASAQQGLSAPWRLQTKSDCYKILN